jgi:hypothetical protein
MERLGREMKRANGIDFRREGILQDLMLWREVRYVPSRVDVDKRKLGVVSNGFGDANTFRHTLATMFVFRSSSHALSRANFDDIQANQRS